MVQSKLFIKTLKEPPKDATTISHQYLVRAGYISQLCSGIWTFLPLGYIVLKKIEDIIRNEMISIGGQELLMPTLQPRELWEETNRWKTIDPPLFKVEDRHNKELCLGPTHEEVVTDLVRKRVDSYKQLPFAVFQIQNKFRNELRSSGGLLRVREFIMKDLYSFHENQADLNNYYQEVIKAYLKIYQRCGLDVVVVQASSGTIGGDESNEFMVICESGESKILICTNCKKGTNLEFGRQLTICPNCSSRMITKNGIEAGHIFKLGDKYSKLMGAKFVNKQGKKKDIIMGCYGIGLGRLLATIVEVFHDNRGIIWPKYLSPYHVHLLNLTSEKNSKYCEYLYETCQKNGIDILYDDRDISQAIKLKDSDLIGISLRLVISSKTGSKIEYKERAKNQSVLLSEGQLLDKIKQYYNYV